jgi:RNA polymerase sigma factor (sigma-70 family)
VLYLIESAFIHRREGGAALDQDFFLLQKMRLGDETAIESFVRKYYQDILKYACYHLADSSMAEDITQETFERFFRSFPKYQHYGKAKNYLYVIASNLCKNTYRKKTEESFYEAEEPWENPLEHMVDVITVEQALRQLPEEMRDVLILHYFQEMKLREIAKLKGIGLPLVKYRIQTARGLLRELLGKEDFL